jgi:hypothetical protein
MRHKLTVRLRDEEIPEGRRIIKPDAERQLSGGTSGHPSTHPAIMQNTFGSVGLW